MVVFRSFWLSYFIAQYYFYQWADWTEVMLPIYIKITNYLVPIPKGRKAARIKKKVEKSGRKEKSLLQIIIWWQIDEHLNWIHNFFILERKFSHSWVQVCLKMYKKNTLHIKYRKYSEIFVVKANNIVLVPIYCVKQLNMYFNEPR